MNNTMYKIRVYLDILNIFLKKLKISLRIQERNEKKILNLLKSSELNINEYELSSKYKQFESNKEPKWEFCLKNWN